MNVEPEKEEEVTGHTEYTVSGHLLITDTFSENGLIKNLIGNLFLGDTSL